MVQVNDSVRVTPLLFSRNQASRARQSVENLDFLKPLTEVVKNVIPGKIGKPRRETRN